MNNIIKHSQDLILRLSPSNVRIFLPLSHSSSGRRLKIHLYFSLSNSSISFNTISCRLNTHLVFDLHIFHLSTNFIDLIHISDCLFCLIRAKIQSEIRVWSFLESSKRIDTGCLHFQLLSCSLLFMSPTDALPNSQISIRNDMAHTNVTMPTSQETVPSNPLPINKKSVKRTEVSKSISAHLGGLILTFSSD